MPANTARHPNDTDLVAFAAGRLRARHRDPIEGHLAGCAACVARLDALFTRSAPDPLLRRLRSLDRATAVDDPTPSPDLPPTVPRDAAAVTYELLPGRRPVLAGFAQPGRECPGGKAVTVTFPSPDPALGLGSERFAGLLRQLAAVDHPNVLMPHAVRHFGGEWGLISDAADGIDLHALACAKDRPDAATACGYIRQAAEGLAAAHARGVVHGDLQLSDLLLFRRTTVRVTGFVTARLHAGPPADPATDIFALGRCLAGLLSGRPDRPPAEFWPNLPPAVAKVLARMTAADPAQRYATMAKAAAGLARIKPTAVGLRRSLWQRLFGGYAT